jgi:hypothetical protein
VRDLGRLDRILQVDAAVHGALRMARQIHLGEARAVHEHLVDRGIELSVRARLFRGDRIVLDRHDAVLTEPIAAEQRGHMGEVVTRPVLAVDEHHRPLRLVAVRIGNHHRTIRRRKAFGATVVAGSGGAAATARAKEPRGCDPKYRCAIFLGHRWTSPSKGNQGGACNAGTSLPRWGGRCSFHPAVCPESNGRCTSIGAIRRSGPYSIARARRRNGYPGDPMKDHAVMAHAVRRLGMSTASRVMAAAPHDLVPFVASRAICGRRSCQK